MCSKAVPVANITIMNVNSGGYIRACRPTIHTLGAAVQMLLEDHRLFQIIDIETDFNNSGIYAIEYS